MCTAGSSQPKLCDVWATLQRIAEESDSHSASSKSTNAEVTAEVAAFFGEPLLAIKEDPLVWWRVNQSRLPTPAKLAQRYLSAPPSSVQSERIFSTNGVMTIVHIQLAFA